MADDAPSSGDKRESIIRKLVRESRSSPRVEAEVDALMREKLGDRSGLLPDERERMAETPGNRPGSAPWKPGVRAKEATAEWLQEHVVDPAERRGLGPLGAAVATVPMTILDATVPETVGELGMAGGPRVPKTGKGAGNVVSLAERRAKLEALNKALKGDDAAEAAGDLVRAGSEATKNKVGIHLTDPSAAELDDAMERASRDNFPAIYVYGKHPEGKTFADPGKRAFEDAIAKNRAEDAAAAAKKPEGKLSPEQMAMKRREENARIMDRMRAEKAEKVPSAKASEVAEAKWDKDAFAKEIIALIGAPDPRRHGTINGLIEKYGAENADAAFERAAEMIGVKVVPRRTGIDNRMGLDTVGRITDARVAAQQWLAQDETARLARKQLGVVPNLAEAPTRELVEKAREVYASIWDSPTDPGEEAFQAAKKTYNTLIDELKRRGVSMDTTGFKPW